MPCMLVQLVASVSGSSSALEAKSKFSASASSDSASISQRQLVDHRHLVLGFRLGRAADRRGQVAEEHLVGIAAGLGRFVRLTAA